MRCSDQVMHILWPAMGLVWLLAVLFHQCSRPCVHVVQSQQLLKGRSSLSRSGTMQSRVEKACLDIVNRLDADIPLAAIQGRLALIQLP